MINYKTKAEGKTLDKNYFSKKNRVRGGGVHGSGPIEPPWVRICDIKSCQGFFYCFLCYSRYLSNNLKIRWIF